MLVDHNTRAILLAGWIASCFCPCADAQSPSQSRQLRAAAAARLAGDIAGVRGRIAIEGPSSLLEFAAVRDEIKLSREQRAALDRAATVTAQPRTEAAKSRETGEPLTPIQRRRLLEIAMQVHGPFALAIPEVQDRLKLDDDQREQVLEALHEADSINKGVEAERNRLLEAFLDQKRAKNKDVGMKDIQEFDRRTEAQFRALRSKAKRECNRVASTALLALTRGQRASLRMMCGEPFPLDQLVRNPGPSAAVVPAESEPRALEPIAPDAPPGSAERASR